MSVGTSIDLGVIAHVNIINSKNIISENVINKVQYENPHKNL